MAEPKATRAERPMASGGQPIAAADSSTSLATGFGRALVGNSGAVSFEENRRNVVTS
jgi:hypothetical protein